MKAWKVAVLSVTLLSLVCHRETLGATQLEVTADELKQKVISMRAEGLSDETIIAYMGQVVLTTALTPDDILAWKKAGIPEPVTQAAMRRVRSDGNSITVPLKPGVTPLDLVIETIVFHDVRVQIGPAVKGLVTVSVVVRVSNPGNHDLNATMKATLLDEKGSVMRRELKRKDVEEGNKYKDMLLKVEISEGTLSSAVSCRLDFSVP